MSASSHTRDHPYAKDQTRGVLSWLERHGRRVVNGRRVIELEMSKVEQHTALRASGFDVPRTIAVAGAASWPPPRAGCPRRSSASTTRAARALASGCSTSHEEFDAYLGSPEFEAPVDGITLLQEYLRAAQPRITRAEIVGGEFIYAITPTPSWADSSSARPTPARSETGYRPAAEPVRAAGGLRTADHRPVPRLRPSARHRDRGLRVHRDRRRPARDLRHQHQHQLQPRNRGGRAALRAARGRVLPRRAACQQARVRAARLVRRAHLTIERAA